MSAVQNTTSIGEHNMKSLQSIIASFLLILLLAGQVLAGTTGKIVGKVTDKQTGEGLFGVNILLVGTTRGTTTDIDGKYQIIGIPIGGYNIRASQIGYAPMEIQGVSIGADETKTLNFTMVSSDVQLTGVTVTADKLVNADATSSIQTMNADAIESIPNVKSVEDVLKLQAGVVKQGNNLFLRGGRSNEVQYLVDGIPTNNIVGNSGELLATNSANSQLAALYAGVQSGVVGGGASGLAVSANAIQSVSVQTSGFDADYGNAQSGIINITTKSGGEKYTGSAQYRTDRLSKSNQNETYTSFSFGGPEPITKYVMPQLGAEVPVISFFVSADMNRSDGPYNYEKNEFYNPIGRRIEMNGFLGGVMNGLGFRYRDNQKNSFTFNSKLRMDLGKGGSSIQYGYRASLTSKHDYFRSWKYRADSSSLGASLSIQNNLGLTHFFAGGKSFIKFYLAKLESRDGNNVAGIDPPEYSSAYENIDVNNDNFNDVSTGQRWFSSRTNVWSTRFDFNSQIHELHLLKTGFEFNYEEIRSTEIQYPTVTLADSTGALISPPFPDYMNRSRGEWPGYGRYRWHINSFPNRGGFYLQDNIEFSGLNLHVGVRYDYLDIGKSIFNEDWVQAWETATKLTAEWAEKDADGNYIRMKNGNTFLYYVTHGNFSPRLSIGYPVTDRIVFYFNYGHFLQYPDRDNYYRDPFILGASGNYVGNPDLKPQRTVQYEAGFDDQFSDDMAFGIRAFYKDIFDYPSLQSRGTNLSVYRNLDYASARGFELTFNQALSGNFSMNLSYSYQIAKGRSSNPLASIYQPEFQLPRETRLDWDQNHTANIFATYRVSPKEEGQFFGLPVPFNNYGVSLTWSYGSGFPYSPYNGGRTTVRNQYLINSESKPSTSTINLSLYKGFKVGEVLNFVATLDVTNLFNRKNVVNILSYTGSAAKYGDLDPDDPAANVVTPWYQADGQLLDPTNFDAPRQVIFGIKMNWD